MQNIKKYYNYKLKMSFENDFMLLRIRNCSIELENST